MALSTSEHELLVDTCTNMNVAANTCREVLEMLRNLGNTGVVDIATHNNDATAHPNGFGTIHMSDFHIGTAHEATAGMSSCYKWPLLSYSGVGYTNLALNSCGNNVALVQFNRFDEENGEIKHALPSSGRIGGLSFANYDEVSSSFVECAAILCISPNPGGNIYQTGYVFRTANSAQAASNTFCIDHTAIRPNAEGQLDLGMSTRRFKDCYLQNTPNVSSDRRMKKDIATLGDSAYQFVKKLNPASFKMTEASVSVVGVVGDGEPELAVEAGTRTHWGFVAQEVRDAMTQAGIEDAAVWCLADKDDPDSRQSLRYEELIAPLVKAVQVLAAKVEALEAR